MRNVGTVRSERESPCAFYFHRDILQHVTLNFLLHLRHVTAANRDQVESIAMWFAFCLRKTNNFIYCLRDIVLWLQCHLLANQVSNFPNLGVLKILEMFIQHAICFIFLFIIMLHFKVKESFLKDPVNQLHWKNMSDWNAAFWDYYYVSFKW